MSQSKLSLLGLYNWDNTILDGMTNNLPSPDRIPTDYPELYYHNIDISPTTVINNLLMACAELEVLYTDPDFLKFAVKQWSDKQRVVWQNMYNSTCYIYNPIWNKDGTITRTETETRDLTNTLNGDVTRTDNLQSVNDNNSTRTDDLTNTLKGTMTQTPDTTETTSTTHDVAGFNSGTLVTSDTDETTKKTTGTVDTEQNNTVTNTGTQSLTETLTKTDTGTQETKTQNTQKDSGTVTRSYEDRETGNIGITMTQQMIDAERVTAAFNIIDYIIDDFKKRFCLLIY